MLTITHTTTSNRLGLPLVGFVALFLTACSSDGSSIIDLDSLQDVITQTLPVDETSTTSGTNVSNTDTTNTDTSSGTGPDIDINSPFAPLEPSTNQIPIELALLTEGEIVTESRFGSTGDPIVERFTLPSSGYELTPDGEIGVLRSVSDSTITVCTYIFQTSQYMCIRAFDLDVNDRVWHLFSMQSNTNGTGVFEFCTIENSDNDCVDKLVENPDGTTTITIDRASANAGLPNASPYFAYENQATLTNRSTDGVLSGHHTNAMTQLLNGLNDKPFLK